MRASLSTPRRLSRLASRNASGALPPDERRAEQRGAGEDQRADQVGAGGGQAHRDAPAHRVAQHHRLHVQLLEGLRDDLGVLLGTPCLGRFGRGAEAGQVDRRRRRTARRRASGPGGCDPSRGAPPRVVRRRTRRRTGRRRGRTGAPDKAIHGLGHLRLRLALLRRAASTAVPRQGSVGPGMIVAAVALAVVYLRGVRRLAARGRRWPLSRTAPFLAGTAVVAVAGVLRDTSFVLHMWEHILIGMAAPLLLALGAPVTLALQTAGPGTRRGIRRALHSRAGAVVAHPVVGWLLFGGTIVVVAFSPVLELRRAAHLVPRRAARPPAAGGRAVPVAAGRDRPHPPTPAVRRPPAGGARRRAVPRLRRRRARCRPPR